MKRNLIISSFLTLGLIACSGEETPNDNNNKQGDTTSDVVVKSCDPGTYGPDCQPVTCVHGSANDGKDGDGKCASCDSGWSGDNCDQCIDNFAGENCDQCADNFTGDNCDQCANGYTGANCVKISCQNGTPDEEDGTCSSCDTGWAGTNCNQCEPNYYGSSCQQCNCLHGACKDGIEGSGKCQCESGWDGDNCDQETICQTGFTGPNCDKCLPEYYGLNCKPCSCKHGECNDTMNGDGYCRTDTCETGWDGVNCNKCTDGYTGSNCVKITCVNGTLDVENGNCASCKTGATGPNCDKCLPEYYGLNCKPCSCKHGECNDTMNGDGYCRTDTCETGWDGVNCNKCADGYTGSNCVKITCVNGTLDVENGNCASCKTGFTGDNCEKCIDGSTGSEEFFNYTYKTICINGKFWMAENLRNQNVDHYSAENKSSNDATYGYLYTWENAMKACPTGWRLPTSEEFLALIGATSIGDKITTTAIQDTSWVSDATNSSGFSASPAGYRGRSGNFNYFGSSALFWSSTPYGSDHAYGLSVDSSSAYVGYDLVSSAYSVHCLKDSN